MSIYEIEGFEPVTVQHVPSVTLHQGETYRSDRAYQDAQGRVWRYFGLSDGASMWLRDGEPKAAWNITAVVDQFGPLADDDAAS